MSLSDSIARFMHRGMLADSPPDNMSQDDLKMYVKKMVACPNPQPTIDFNFSVSVGDVYQPISVSLMDLVSGPSVIRPSQRFVIYQLSYSSSQYDLTGDMEFDGDAASVSNLILVYNRIEDDADLDLHDIGSVVCGLHHLSLIEIVARCTKVGNLSHLLR